MLALGLLALLATEPALPEATPTPRAAAVYYGLGMSWADAAGPAGTNLNPWMYPDAGVQADFAPAYLEANTPMPILIPDLIGTLFRWLGGGPDSIILWYALNGPKEPGAIRVADGSARAVIALSDRAAFEAGLFGSFTFVSVLIPEFDERISVQPVALAPSFAVRAGNPGGVIVRGAWYAGNATTRFSAWNPVVGAGARVIVPLRGRFSAELLADGSMQRLDLRSYREPITSRQLAGVDWYGIWSGELRLCWRYDPRR